MTERTALITGITGQDGSYLAELLLDKGYEVHGLARRTALHPDSLRNIEHIQKELVIHFGDLVHDHHMCSVINDVKPSEIYNLAGQSDVRLSFDIPEYTGDATGLGAARLLEAVRRFSPNSKVYLASSSEMFGNTPGPQNERTPFAPRSPYGAAKLYAHHMALIYRDAYDLFIACGILFNHESPRRGRNFVTRKVTSAAAEIVRGERKELYLGNMEGRRDWGYAPDYVRAMWMMLQHSEPDDFVVGTGETHTVRELAEEAFNHCGLNWKNYVKTDPSLYRPTEVNHLCADASKVQETLDWKPTVRFQELVGIMVEHELKPGVA